jgi:hypothetical protein
MTPHAAHVKGVETGSGVASRQVKTPEDKVLRDIAAVFMSWNLAGFHNNATLLNVIFWN